MERAFYWLFITGICLLAFIGGGLAVYYKLPPYAVLERIFHAHQHDIPEPADQDKTDSDN